MGSRRLSIRMVGALCLLAAIALAVLTVVILWALNFIAGKIALRNLPAPAVASFRVSLGGVAMLPAPEI